MNNTSVFSTAWWATILTTFATGLVAVLSITQPGVHLPGWVAGLGVTIAPVLSVVSLFIYHFFHHKTTTTLAQIEAASVQPVVRPPT